MFFGLAIGRILVSRKCFIMAKIITDEKKIDELLSRGVEKIYPSRQTLEAVLISGKRLKLYLGVDPTGPHLHLGHLTNLLTLKRFQELGHEVIFLIGDFTAQIGDPTDKLSARQPLTKEQIKENLKTFRKQAGKILSFSGKNAVKIDFNSRWHSKMKFDDLIKLAHHFTVQQMIQRDMFQDRLRHWVCPTCKETHFLDPRVKDFRDISQRCIKCGWIGNLDTTVITEDKPIGLHEFLYPLMQGYDSVVMDVDLEIGGNDQTFNMLIGRDLQKIYHNKEKFVLTTKLLVNPKTGNKLMNKSEGGMINLDDTPGEMFGKIMAVPDEATLPLAEFSSEMPMAEIENLKKAIQGGGNPRDAKLKVSEAVVKTIFGQEIARKSMQDFLGVFSRKEKPQDISLIRIGQKEMKLVDLLVEVKLASSKSEARRLITQGGVRINGDKKTNPEEIVLLEKEIILQVGKRHFRRVMA